MTIVYLDVDDEITTAVARLRRSEEPDVALVLPAGSRIATSRINFRLLAREAHERQRRLAIVTPEEGVRAVAVSAGLPAYGSVGDYEQARSGLAAPGDATAASAAAAAATADAGTAWAADRSRAGPTAEHGSPAGAPAAGAPPAGSPRGRRPADLPVAAGPPAARAERRRGLRRPLVAGLLAVALVIAGAAAWQLLPSATITVTPIGVAVGPISVTVVADPAATTADAANAIVPAQTISLPLQASATFPASGAKVTETKASGSVTFLSYDTGGSTSVAGGSTVSTATGIGFVTAAAVTVPKATFTGSGQNKTLIPGQKSVAVQAALPGTAGNVAAGVINTVPKGKDANLLAVSNPQPTTGGSHTEQKLVVQADYVGAVATLTTRLRDQLAQQLAAPSSAPPGVTLFPSTASLGQPGPDRPATAVVGTLADTFTLTLSSSATVTGVDTAQLAPLAEQRLRASVPAGRQLFSDSVKTKVSEGRPQGAKVAFEVQASGETWQPVDAPTLVAQVKGRSVAEARQLLAAYGAVFIELWPGFVATIPTLDARVQLTVAAPRRSTP